MNICELAFEIFISMPYTSCICFYYDSLSKPSNMFVLVAPPIICHVLLFLPCPLTARVRSLAVSNQRIKKNTLKFDRVKLAIHIIHSSVGAGYVQVGLLAH